MYCYIPAAPRLACVKPVASVHPEPGSNSPLLLYFYLSFSLLSADRRTDRRPFITLDGGLPPSSFVLYLIALFQCTLFRFSRLVFSSCECKVKSKFRTVQIFLQVFFKISFGASLSKLDRHCGTAVFRFASAKVGTFSLHSKYFTNFFLKKFYINQTYI